MKNLVCIIIISLVFGSGALAGDLIVGGDYMKNGHSEDTNDRCINDGYSFNVGYDFMEMKYEPWEWLGFELQPGGLFTYTNYETAHRDYSWAPESKERRESSLTLIGVVKPTVRVWRVSYYLMLGAGIDYMQSDGMDYGWLEKAHGLDFRITDRVTLGVNERKFMRNDGGFYKYQGAQISITF